MTPSLSEERIWSWKGPAPRVARLAVLRPNFRNLAVFQPGWPYDFWVGRLAFLAVFENLVPCVWVSPCVVN